MLADAHREELNRALGAEAVREHEELELEGHAFALTLRPADGTSLATALRTLGERGLAALVCGGRSRLGLGNPPRDARVLLSTEALAGVEELDEEEGVLCARAGTPLTELRARARAAGWELPCDPPGARATLGGTLAAAAIGPRHLGFGRLRDLVLGLQVVLGDGTRSRCGGRVVKNVTGYDLMKLHVGALGTLGVIESAWIRLRPLPEAVRVVAAAGGALPGALESGLAAARLASARAVAVVDPELAAAVEPTRRAADGHLVLAEFAGDEAVVARDAQWLGERAPARDAAPGSLARLRGLQGEVFGPAGMRFRVSARPSRLGSVASQLRAAGAALLIYPGTGLSFARFPVAAEPDEARVQDAWRAARASAAAGEGACVLEAAPPWVKQARDVFGFPPGALRLWRALKQRFDPAGVLNPGRFAGGL